MWQRQDGQLEAEHDRDCAKALCDITAVHFHPHASYKVKKHVEGCGKETASRHFLFNRKSHFTRGNTTAELASYPPLGAQTVTTVHKLQQKKKKDLNTIFLPTDTPWTDTMCFCNAQCNTLPGEWGKLCSVHGLRCRPHCKCLWRSVEKHSHLNHVFKPLYGHYFCLKGCAGTTAEVTFPYLGFSIYSIYIQFQHWLFPCSIKTLSRSRKFHSKVWV